MVDGHPGVGGKSLNERYQELNAAIPVGQQQDTENEVYYSCNGRVCIEELYNHTHVRERNNIVTSQQYLDHLHIYVKGGKQFCRVHATWKYMYMKYHTRSTPQYLIHATWKNLHMICIYYYSYTSSHLAR